MTLRGWIVSMFAVLALGATAWPDDPPSLVLARETVAACRGDVHREKMRIEWPTLEDERPPEGAEVTLVRGFQSYQLTRLVLRQGTVQAASVTAVRSWFYNQDAGESFDAAEFEVATEQFTLAWNAARRILAASDARLEPEPEDHPRGGSSSFGTHESVDWIRMRVGAEAAPLHCADRGRHRYGWDKVRKWDGLRDQAVFKLFAPLVTGDPAGERRGAVEGWSDFAADEIRRVADDPDARRIRRDVAFVGTCLRVLGEVGKPTAEDEVARFVSTVSPLEDPGGSVKNVLEEAGRAATRLRIRHRWDREHVMQTLRTLERGTWARTDQAKWLQRTFREQDPEGWALFLVEEVTRADARPDDVAAAAALLKDLPEEDTVPLLRELLLREQPHVRVEAALTLQGIRPADVDARQAVVDIALDRSIACGWRPDLADRWSRNRALAVALDWGALAPNVLREHMIAPEPDDPEFLESASAHLQHTPHALSPGQVRDAWRCLLDASSARRILAAASFLTRVEDVESKNRMLAALDRLARRIEDEGEERAGTSSEVVQKWRLKVLQLDTPDDAR